MSTPALTPAQLQEAVNIVAEHGSIAAAARALKMSRTTFQSRYEQAANLGYVPGKDVPLQRRLSGQGDHGELQVQSNDEIRTLDDLIRVCQIDTDTWAIDKWVCNKWGDKWQIKAWLTQKRAVQTARAEIEALKAALPDKLGRVVTKPRLPKKGDTHLLEIAPVDFHFGKLAWHEETGHGNYDIKIAERLFRESMATLVERTRTYRFNRVLLVCGNDMLHIDSRAGTTTGGTQMDFDSRYQNLYVEMRKLLVWCLVYLAQEVAPVTCLMVPGNHDTDSTFTLGDSLECWFRDDPSVTIDNRPAPRKYHQHGKVMLLFTHGDKGKRADYPLLMATEQPDMFGQTRFREIHTGHFHQTKVEEKHGIRVRILPSMTATDAWHSENMYVGNLRATEAFVWDSEMGLVATVLAPVVT